MGVLRVERGRTDWELVGTRSMKVCGKGQEAVLEGSSLNSAHKLRVKM